jgi:acetyl esterase/lipase
MTPQSLEGLAPDYRKLADAAPKLLSPETLPVLRAGMAQQLSQVTLKDDDALEVSVHWAPTRAGEDVRVVVYRPKAQGGSLPAILHMHGGGFILGAPEMTDGPNRRLAAELGCVVASVDYRLAPDAIFPGPVEDCYAALLWLGANAAKLGVRADCIALKGDSAGGGLAASLSLLARDRGEVKIVHQHLVAPMLDDRTGASGKDAGVVWTAAHNRFAWSCLLGGPPGGAEVGGYAAAARAENLAGLPSTFIGIGAQDLFLAENLDYGRRLSAAGVEVELHVWPGAPHGFMLVQDAPVTQLAERVGVSALRRALMPQGV